ncbi:hypothetical protein ARMSODRAFT_1011634 [Armillaria solidipes]|uniref:Uncharacterized protein n=1 Tax=Armillaria solidipes TaxID=1076256 RepID=A0A2H3CAV6_9AGAR|nr:hypothetical protein ARMSODRAFT_1011634 [Armillaria solidipes]
MAIQTNIPPDLTDVERAFILQELDGELNSRIFYALLHGLHIYAVTLWNTCKRQPVRRAMVIIIALLYIVTTINIATAWVYTRLIFVNNGQSFSAVCTVLASSTIIWRCWMVCRQQWFIILLPILFLVSAIVVQIIVIYKICAAPYDPFILGTVLYASFILVTNLWCTLLIIYRIATVIRAGNSAGGGLRTYHHVIELLVESAALYSIFAILYVACFARQNAAFYYFNILAAIAKGVAPTLLVGRIAAGRALGARTPNRILWRDDIGIENGIREDDPIAQPEDSHCDNKEVDNHRDDLEDTRPEDDPNAIII